jgi:excisionase family DNA binding protein
MEDTIIAGKLDEINRQIRKGNELSLLNKEVFTVDEASLYSGLSKSQIYHLTSLRKLKHYKPSGKQIFVRREDLIEYLLQNPVATQAEIEKSVINNYKI